MDLHRRSSGIITPCLR